MKEIMFMIAFTVICSCNQSGKKEKENPFLKIPISFLFTLMIWAMAMLVPMALLNWKRLIWISWQIMGVNL
jgi:hypothetical protein